MYKLFDCNSFVYLILLLFNISCEKPIGRQKQYLHTLQELAQQRGKYFVSVCNKIQDPSQRAMILQENRGEKIAHLEQRLDFIETFSEYPNRYLIADTALYYLSIIDIPFQTDSITVLANVHGKYLGYMIDTMLGAIHRYLVIDLTVSCTFRVHDPDDAISYSDVIVLYDIQGDKVFPIETLDYRCSAVNEYDKDAYLDICFCQKTPRQFLNFLQDYMHQLREHQNRYPIKLKKVASTK